MITDKDIDQLMLQNQQGFDRMPSSKAWEQIGSTLQNEEIKEKSYQLRKWVSVASVFLFVSIGYLFFAKFLQTNISLSNIKNAPKPNEETLIALENNRDQNSQSNKTSPELKPEKEIKIQEEPIENNKPILNTPKKEGIKEVGQIKTSTSTSQPLAKQIIHLETSKAEKESQQKSALLSQATEINEEVGLTANVEDLSDINRSNLLYSPTLEKEGITGTSVSRLSSKKDKSSVVKSKSAHVYDYYSGVWIAKNHIENTTSRVFGNKITLVIEQDESVYVYGIDRETLPFKMTNINELHLSLVDSDNSNIKISYLSAKEALLVYTDNEGKASLVLKRQ
jgi:hypothetical protein